ncbi:MAG: flagellar protein export ATPase FliI [Firmicutes bacterium]|nr:flagellar protein export ATPase FliI [Bacillota bacterium]
MKSQTIDIDIDFDKYYREIWSHPVLEVNGRVTQVIGLVIEVSGLRPFVGEVCLVEVNSGEEPVPAEVVGFREGRALLMPLGNLSGVGPGCLVKETGSPFTIKVGPGLLGKVLNGLGKPVMDGEELEGLFEEYLVESSPPNPLEREPISKVMATGVRAIDTLLTCGQGQRIGIFSGSGVGKSTLLGMIARYSEADVNVIGLVGERGREVLDFIKDDLGPEGLKRSVLIVSTSDRPALERVKAALAATAVAEYFRDQGQKVILMMDSVTRFAMALREIGLAIGEPPATKGYTPSVFAALPRLLERSGTSRCGSITGFYTVLVDGDDMNEPIADAVRGILDGHIVLSRKLASQNHYPAIDVLQSVSRLMPSIVDKEHLRLAGRIRDLLSAYRESEDLINIGAYVKGSNARIDEAIAYREPLNRFLCQDLSESVPWKSSREALQGLFAQRS